ncbi:MAG: hypothetical protein A2381_04090 [Bdellovibrionales bacterium RIFOXYB1_FULL_37_110]|nr:MAG: hypothetical protein A2417_10200 [Bdellovibrionales bacterium RIFOXYC1_FULL_37_79]OFZ59103.1 MAG: hypothetical protein A2381_04090 [Bdellovibrionales bacterium RIFOXYB1_FULL_37_110]OFZ64110.1 MAG: hypothetical protein A2577_15210 [Bdellovibrionales bacterium RIFOXYD1_FULL_36_51]
MKNLIILLSFSMISVSALASHVTSVTRAFECNGMQPQPHPRWKGQMTLDTSNKSYTMHISSDRILLNGTYDGYQGGRTTHYTEDTSPGKAPRALYETFKTIGDNDGRFIIGVEPQILDGEPGIISINYVSFYSCS